MGTDPQIGKAPYVAADKRQCIFESGRCDCLRAEQEPAWEICSECPRGAAQIREGRLTERLFEVVSRVAARNRQLQRSNRGMALLLEILSFVQGAGDLETTLRIILTAVTSGYSIGFNRAFLFMLDEDGQTLHGILAVGPRSGEEAREIWDDLEQTTECLEDIIAASRAGGRQGDRDLTQLVRTITIPVGEESSSLGRCLSQGETIVVKDRSEWPEGDVLHRLGSKAFVCTPIMTSGKTIGLIVADNMITGEPPGDEQVALLKALAYQVGQLIVSTTHREDIERRLQELSTLNEVSKGILSTTDLESDLSLIARISAQVLNARGAALRLVDDETGSLVTKAVFGVTVGDTAEGFEEGGQAIAEKVAADGSPILVKDARQGAPCGPAPARRRNLICIPLVRADHVIGTLTVFDKIQPETFAEEGFTKDDLRFLDVLGGQAAIAIENAKMFENLRASERRIRELHRHLLRSERLAALGELSSQVAHEIRNPLTAIGGFARSVARRMSPEDPDKEHMEIIVRETERLERILTEQLCFAKLSPPEFKPEDINSVVRETLGLFSEKFQAKDARVVTDLAEGLPKVSIDADKIKQVLINLLQNAVDSIARDGRIEIKTSRPDRNLEIRICNDGPPIPYAVLDRLFVPFATTKSGGSGLGLPIAYEIVYEHGGAIDVVSKEDTGTVFLITLPLVLEGDRRSGPVDRRSSMRDRRRLGRVP